LLLRKPRDSDRDHHLGRGVLLSGLDPDHPELRIASDRILVKDLVEKGQLRLKTFSSDFVAEELLKCTDVCWTATRRWLAATSAVSMPGAIDLRRGSVSVGDIYRHNTKGGFPSVWSEIMLYAHPNALRV
jgi:hypothetical protein